MAGLAVGGPFNVTTSTQCPQYVYYVPMNMEHMRRLYEFYIRGDSLISRANAIRSDQAFGQGYFLEWADRDQIMPDDAYDYRAGIQSLLEKARMWRDVFGFVAFRKPMAAARDEVDRQKMQATLTPEQIAEQLIKEYTNELQENVGSTLGDTKTRDNDSEPQIDRGAREREIQRIQVGTSIPRSNTSKSRQQMTRLGVSEEQRVVLKPPLKVRETKMYNGNASTASDSVLEFVKDERSRQSTMREVMQRDEQERQERQRQINLMDLLITIEQLQIVDLDAGSFFLEIDELMDTKRMVFVPNCRSANSVFGAYGTGVGGGQLRFVDYDKNVEVFVWPDRWPTRDGVLHTDYDELLRLHEMLREAEDNVMDADWQACHPTPFIQQTRAPTKVDATELNEEDMYGEDVVGADPDSIFSKKNMSPTEITSYKRDIRDALVLEATVTAAQNRQLTRQAQDIAMGMGRATRSVRGGLPTAQLRSALFEKSGIMHLTGGLALGGTVVPKPVIAVNEYREVYYRQLSVALGIPLSYLRGEQAGRGSSSAGKGNTKTSGGIQGVTSHSTTTTESLMRSTVMRDREQSSLFFDEMYNRIFRASDTAALKSELYKALQTQDALNEVATALIDRAREKYKIIRDARDLDDNLSSVLSESARVVGLAKDTYRIIQLKNRLRLKFVKAPFMEPDQVQMMYSVGAVSHTEMVNILRQNAGLSKLTDREVRKMFDENMEMVAAQTAANQPPNAPDSTTETTVVTEGKESGGGGAKGKGGAAGGASKPTSTSETQTTITKTKNEPQEKTKVSESKEEKGKKKKREDEDEDEEKEKPADKKKKKNK